MSLPFSCVSYNLHDAKSYPIIYSLVEIHHSGKNAVKSLWGDPWDLPAVELHKSRWEKSLKHWYQTEKTEINLKKSEGNIRLVIKYIIRSFLIHPQPYVRTPRAYGKLFKCCLQQRPRQNELEFIFSFAFMAIGQRTCSSWIYKAAMVPFFTKRRNLSLSRLAFSKLRSH